ncbi:MAG TPA: GTP cyclohydrolase II [Wenzhouxiangellaceae bacterium]|nr:GTP cyclohydrolase II [Wenzhouxiangellaceae bacterium]
MQQCERAMFDLRRGIPIIIRAGAGDNGSSAGQGVADELDSTHRIVFPIETGTARSLDTLDTAGIGSISLVVAPQRLRMLGAPDAADCACLPLGAGQPLDLETCRRIAYGPAAGDEFDELALSAPSRADRAALALLKRALLIPAALTAPINEAASRRLIDDRTALDVSVDEIDACVETSAGRLHHVSEADVPLEVAQRTRFILFREPDGLREHVALQIGDPAEWPDAVPVRLHSACLTGDLFGSLRCDCGEQLKNGVSRIAAAGGGVLLYLAQEGRGIGLANKFRAYALQDTGADTIDADGTLGFSPDERRYSVAVEMLEHLGVKRISLLTNNPRKLAAIKAGGIEVVDREAVYGRLNAHNERYLRAKADRSGHLLEEWLGTESESD